MARPSMNRLARNITSDVSPLLPGGNPISMHLGTLSNVNPGLGLGRFNLHDPDNSYLDNIPILQSYSPNFQPRDGHKVWAYRFQNTLVVAGMSMAPVDIVTF